MMAKKQKFFKNLLASSAIASVVASLGSSSMALAVAHAPQGALMMGNTNLDNDGTDHSWHTINNDATDEGRNYNMHNAQQPLVVNRPAITYHGGFELTADIADATITAINLADHNGTLKVDQNLSIGSIVLGVVGAARLVPTIAVGRTLTLTGTAANDADVYGFAAAANTYTGLGNVELGGNASTLVVQAGNTIRTVTAARNGEGILSFEGAGGATGDIGTDLLSLAEVRIGAGAVDLGGHVWAANTNLTDAMSVLNVGANKTIHSVVNFQNAGATINVGAGGTIDGNITGTAGGGGGILNFARAGTVTGTIGATNALATVNFGIAAGQPNPGGGAVELRGVATAANFNINHAVANVSARSMMNGAVTFNADGRLTAGGGITGNVDFNGNNGIITLGADQTIHGAVDSAAGAGGADIAGVLNFAGAGEVTEDIGATRALAEVNFNGAGVVHLRQAASAETFTFNQAATLHAHDDITGNVHFKGYNGIIKLEDAKKVTGAITTARNGEGTLTFDGAGEVTGNIGTIDVDNPANDKRIAH